MLISYIKLDDMCIRLTTVSVDGRYRSLHMHKVIAHPTMWLIKKALLGRPCSDESLQVLNLNWLLCWQAVPNEQYITTPQSV